MKRRTFIGLAGRVFAWLIFAGALPAHAQTPNRIYRLGHIGNSPLGETLTRETALPELAKLGFVEGGNLVFDARVGEPAAMPGIMREMLAAQPDAIVAIGPAPLAAAGAATRRVPIVGFGAEAVQLGLAASYARVATSQGS
jgi:putative ABC transport system substrate-binding protein